MKSSLLKIIKPAQPDTHGNYDDKNGEKYDFESIRMVFHIMFLLSLSCIEFVKFQKVKCNLGINIQKYHREEYCV